MKASAFITCFSSKPPKSPQPADPTPTEQDAAVIASRDNERARRSAAASKTVLTSASGVTAPASTAPKTLLGQ